MEEERQQKEGGECRRPLSVGGDKATTDSPGKSTGAPAGLAVEGVEGKLGSLGVVVVEAVASSKESPRK